MEFIDFITSRRLDQINEGKDNLRDRISLLQFRENVLIYTVGKDIREQMNIPAMISVFRLKYLQTQVNKFIKIEKGELQPSKKKRYICTHRYPDGTDAIKKYNNNDRRCMICGKVCGKMVNSFSDYMESMPNNKFEMEDDMSWSLSKEFELMGLTLKLLDIGDDDINSSDPFIREISSIRELMLEMQHLYTINELNKRTSITNGESPYREIEFTDMEMEALTYLYQKHSKTSTVSHEIKSISCIYDKLIKDKKLKIIELKIFLEIAMVAFGPFI